MKKFPLTLHWFRRDLRLDDNKGLLQALKSNHPVLGLFIFDSKILSKLPKKDARLEFIHENLKEMNEDLNELGSGLLTMHGDPEEIWKSLFKTYDIKEVFTCTDYEPYAIKRDEFVKKICEKNNATFKSVKDQVIFEKSEVTKDDGKPYTVYTPYKNKWLKTYNKDMLKSVDCKKYFNNFLSIAKKDQPKFPSLKDLGFIESGIPFPKKAVKKDILKDYDKNRDFPSIKGTSLLSVHLRFGTVSVRKCYQAALKLNKVWMSELIWREFFMQILYHFPHVKDSAFREKYDKIPWRNNKKEFKAWCEGNTGYPIVDAGMRELNQTGHMHNRVRMITASFLCKHLLIDWRWGEKYFAEKLLDFDLSANNGNWQWAAGTGCDASPYFRVFNPHTQFDKFDKKAQYVRKWVPEFETETYAEPIVEHKTARVRAIETYKKALS